MSSPKKSDLLPRSSLLVALLLCSVLSLVSAQTYEKNYDDYIFFHWKGALTSNSLVLKVFAYNSNLTTAGLTAYVGVYTKSGTTPENVQVQEVTFSNDPNYPVGTVTLSGLTNSLVYYYSFIFTTDSSFSATTFETEYDPTQMQEFNFTTLGIALTPSNFTFGVSSSAQTGSTGGVFTRIAGEALNFFVHAGNMHYADITTNNITAFYQAYYEVFASNTQKTLYQTTPLFYVWDDNDYGGSDSNGNSPSKAAAYGAYNAFVPSGPLRTSVASDDSAVFPDAPVANTDTSGYTPYDASSGTSGIFRNFIVGRCYFIVLDLRSFKDLSQNDILGSPQSLWLQNQFIFVRNNPQIKQIFIVSSIPWIHDTDPSGWSPYTGAQAKIAQWAQVTINRTNTQVMLLAGGARMIAFDNGYYNKYGSFPVVQAGSLDQSPSCAGGPYSHGLYTGREQFAVLNVVDNGTKVCVQVSLKRGAESLIQYDTCNGTAPLAEKATCPVTGTTIAAKGASFPWLLILVGVVIGIVVIYLLYMAYTKWRQNREMDSDLPQESYLEMKEKNTRKEENNLL